jgi:hypothetical protein
MRAVDNIATTGGKVSPARAVSPATMRTLRSPDVDWEPPYRANPRPLDREQEAVATLAHRADILKRCVVLGCILAAVPLAILGYSTVEEVQLSRLHAASIQMSAVVGVVPPVAILWYAIGPLSRVLLAVALRFWIPSLSTTMGVSRESLFELTDAWE